MTYCKNYCEEEGISTSKLNEAQKTLYYIAENMKMDKSISEDGYKHFQMAIKALEQEPKTGHWIGQREYCENLGVMPSGLCVYEWCSNCDCGIDVRNWQEIHHNYCPNCGAKMESEEV